MSQNVKEYNIHVHVYIFLMLKIINFSCKFQCYMSIEICLMIYFSGVMASGEATVFLSPLLEVQEIVSQLIKLENIFVDENDFKRPDVNIYPIV